MTVIRESAAASDLATSRDPSVDASSTMMMFAFTRSWESTLCTTCGRYFP